MSLGLCVSMSAASCGAPDDLSGRYGTDVRIVSTTGQPQAAEQKDLWRVVVERVRGRYNQYDVTLNFSSTSRCTLQTTNAPHPPTFPAGVVCQRPEGTWTTADGGAIGYFYAMNTRGLMLKLVWVPATATSPSATVTEYVPLVRE